MNITKTPTRITLGGGGTDLPEFYSKHGGFWISATIDKFVYVAVKHRFEEQLRISYSELELINTVGEIKHPIICEIFKEFGISSHYEMITFADLPGRTGLGASGSFSVGLINAISRERHRRLTDIEIAELAYTIERERLGRPIGKQDPYAAQFGGLRVYEANKNGEITHYSIVVPNLAVHLSLFYTDIQRDSYPILREVKKSSEHMQKIKQIGIQSAKALMDNDLTEFGKLMDQHWRVKKKITPMMSTPFIDKCYSTAKRKGALGGKIIGAGGGGFLLFFTMDWHEKRGLEKEMYKMGLRHVPFSLHMRGSEELDV